MVISYLMKKLFCKPWFVYSFSIFNHYLPADYAVLFYFESYVINKTCDILRLIFFYFMLQSFVSIKDYYTLGLSKQ